MVCVEVRKTTIPFVNIQVLTNTGESALNQVFSPLIGYC